MGTPLAAHQCFEWCSPAPPTAQTATVVVGWCSQGEALLQNVAANSLHLCSLQQRVGMTRPAIQWKKQNHFCRGQIEDPRRKPETHKVPVEFTSKKRNGRDTATQVEEAYPNGLNSGGIKWGLLVYIPWRATSNPETSDRSEKDKSLREGHLHAQFKPIYTCFPLFSDYATTDHQLC